MPIDSLITYSTIYNIVKDKGPISIKGIAKILSEEYRISEEDFKLSVHCKVGGILSSLSQNGFIVCLPRRDPPDYKIWKTSGKIKGNVYAK
jgi:hypothetical protein